MSIIYKLDISIQKLTRWLLDEFKNFNAFILTAIIIFSIIYCPFEYGEGISDLDLFEIIYPILFFTITYRFFKRGVIAGLKKRDIFSEYSKYLSLTVLTQFFCGNIHLSKVMKDKGIILPYDFISYSNHTEILWFAIILVVLYAFAPIPNQQDTSLFKQKDNMDPSESVLDDKDATPMLTFKQQDKNHY